MNRGGDGNICFESKDVFIVIRIHNKYTRNILRINVVNKVIMNA